VLTNLLDNALRHTPPARSNGHGRGDLRRAPAAHLRAVLPGRPEP
jgi:hypothetical protein